MKYIVTALRDEVAKEFTSPQVEMTDARAIRGLETVVLTQRERKEGLFFSHGADFTLYKIGEYDSETGQVESCTPEMLRKVGEI